jgi:hypothetical protein
MSYVDVKSVRKVQAKMQVNHGLCDRTAFPSNTSVNGIVVFCLLCLVSCYFGTSAQTGENLHRSLLSLSLPTPDLPLGGNRTNWMRTWWPGAGFVFVAPPSDFPTTSHFTIAQ